MGLRQYTNAPRTEEEKLAAMAEALGVLRQDGDAPEQPINTPEPEGAQVALTGNAGPEVPNQEEPQAPPLAQQQIIEFLRQQKAQNEPYLRQQQAGVDELRSKIQDYENQKLPVNLAPLLAWHDTNFGGNLAKGYQAPLTQEEKLAKIAGLYNQLQAAQKGVSDEILRQGNDKLLGQMMLAGQKNEWTKERAGARLTQQESNTISGWVNKIHTNPNVNKYSQLIDQAQTDYGTLNKIIKNKEIMPNQLFSELQIGLARLINGPGALPESRAEKVEMQSFEQYWGDKLQKLSGEIQGPVPESFKNQLLHSFERLISQWEERRRGAAQRVASGIPTDRIKGSDKYINEALSAYGTSLPGKGVDGNIKESVSKFDSLKEKPQERKAEAGLTIGQVVGGHKYLGGNPNDENSWEK